MLDEPPVRMCCMRRHFGVQCPDGKVMCCICFERFEVSELSKTDDGKPIDICKQCAEYEHSRVEAVAARGVGPFVWLVVIGFSLAIWILVIWLVIK